MNDLYYTDDPPQISDVVLFDVDTPWYGYEISEKIPEQQSGTGIDPQSILKLGAQLMSYLPQAYEKLDNLAFGELGTSISNTLSEKYNKNPEYKPGFAGEKHIILPTSYGLTRTNYAGPGTNLKTRLNRGDKGVDGPYGIDQAAQKHDILYSQANDYDDIREADEIFLNDVKNSSQTPLVKKTVSTAIKLKNIGEDFGFLSKDRYLTNLNNPNKSGKGRHKFKIIKDNRTPGKLPPALKMKRKALY